MSKEEKYKNPFLDDDDEYVEEDLTIRRKQLLEEKRRIEERTLQSSHNSLGLLHESEQVGILTAEELVKQREQLQNIEENLDFINSTMRSSQKHINSMKSLFGGIKNYFQGSIPATSTSSVPAAGVSREKPLRSLDTTVEKLKSDTRLNEATHPARRILNLPYDENDSLDSAVQSGKSLTEFPKSSNAFEEKLDSNLESMCMGLGRLKYLAKGLNDEIDQQNEMIDNIHNKTDKADETLESQNRQIKRLLKK